ncbi:MAG: hypothetical protein HFF43_00465 [Lawsonibacter sp.]|jgi:hypothetical protein|nr:hypothetical protein [Lawsonibacter sp.]
MQQKLIRGGISLALFFLILFLAEPLTTPFFDEISKSICYLAAVVGAGCYWIGSRD